MEIVKIDLVPSGVMPSCHASQYDIGREIRFLLTDGGEEYTLAGTETISIELRKPDGTSETIAIENTSSNYVDWETSDGELDLSGVYLAEISIKNGDDVLGSANFIVKTEADPYDGTGVHVETVGPADICTFETTLPEPLQSVIVNIEATGGNGTPDNPNPINGYSEANITVNGNTVTIAFGQTVYGGVLDVTRGKLHVTHGFYSGTWGDGVGDYTPDTMPDMKRRTFIVSPIAGNLVTNNGKAKCNITDVFSTANNLNSPHFYVYDNLYLYAPRTLDDSTPIQCSYVLATPFDIDLTPVQIRALVGTNNVFADCGQTTVKYLKAGA